MFLEYRTKDMDWELFNLGEINVGRNYEMFGNLTGGRVRTMTDIKTKIEPKGLPDDELSLLLTQILAEETEKNFGYHNHSWLSYKEYKTILKQTKMDEIPMEYSLLLKMMKFLEKSGHRCRLVFWFDN